MGIQMDIPAGPRAAARARRSMERLRSRIDPTTFDDLRLLVSELVTNSSRHAGIDEGTPIRVEISLEGASIRGEVVDPGHGFDRADRRAPGPASGWGLHLLDRIAAAWGVDSSGATKVWFELPADRRERAS